MMIRKKITNFGLLILSIILFGITPSQAEAATAIYRSASPSATSALSTTTASNITLSIAGSTATFSGVQLDNIGVGDVIQYDSDNNGTIDSLAFIHGRTSSSVYTVKNSSGGTATSTSANDTDWSIFRAYTSLANAEKGIENTGIDTSLRNFDDWTAGGTAVTDEVGKDLVSTDQQWNISLYANGVTSDTTTVTVDGWTTSANQYLNIYTSTSTSEVGVSQRHSGIWDDSKYNLNPSSGTYGILVSDQFVWVDGLQVTIRTGGVSSGINVSLLSVGDNLTKISHNIVRGIFSDVTTTATGVYVANGFLSLIWNNLVYDIKNSTSTTGFFALRSYGSTTAYNNTVYNSVYCFRKDSGTFVLKNNIAQNCIDGFLNADASSDYNISSLSADALGAHSKNSTTVSFVDATNKNFHLQSSDTYAKDSGTSFLSDPSGLLSFSTDIDGETRSGSWDIGADEYVAPPSDTTPPTLTSIASSTTDTTATITWTTNESATSTVDYGLTTGYGTASSSAITTTSHSFTLTGLATSTTYHFKLSSWDAVGNLATSSDYTFVTTYTPVDISTSTSYSYPIGIPQAWINPNVAQPSRPEYWTSEIPGYYYVDYINGSDSGRAYGYPGAPRKTIPSPIPAGSRVELSGNYTATGSVVITFAGNSGEWVAGASGPAWLVGYSNSVRTSFSGNILIVGEYGCIEHIDNLAGRHSIAINSVSPDLGRIGHHILLRNSESSGFGTAADTTGGVAINGNTDTGGAGEDIIVYNVHVHNYGDMVMDGSDHDYIGVFVTSNCHRIWILDNLIHDMTGGGIQLTSNSSSVITTDHVYAGRNHIYNTVSNGMASKGARYSVYSENTIHDVIPNAHPYDSSVGIVGQYGATDQWLLFNTIYNCADGVRRVSGIDGYEKIYIIGNLIYNLAPVTLEGFNDTA